jgi:hypothetical protein
MRKKIVKSGNFLPRFLLKLSSKGQSLCFFLLRHLQDTSNKLLYVLFGPILLKKSKKNCKFLNFLAVFSIFEAEARLGALKNLKSRRTQVVSYKYMHVLRLQA